MATPYISSVRISPDNDTVLSQLGLLKDLVGNWHGEGFNLVARPFFGVPATATTPAVPANNLFLELNLTHETLKFDAISSPVPNRGTFQQDINLFGLTYLQKIADATTGGALHIEPGIWITHDATTTPVENPPATGQIVARMASIPHGNALLAGGSATPFTGPPTLGAPGGAGFPAFSIFPSFNTTPNVIPAAGLATINAAGSSEFLNAPAGGFPQYTLTNAASGANPRTPFLNTPPVIDPAITQALLNDPITLLQARIQEQVDAGCTFEGVAINIASQSPITFFTTASTVQPAAGAAPVGGPTVVVDVADSSGGVENLPFLTANADAALVYSTFWIEKVTPPVGYPFMQLQYAQFVFLNFPAVLIPSALAPPQSAQGKLNFSWPHVSVATLTKTFG